MDMRRLNDDVYIQPIEWPAANPADGTIPASYIDVSEFERWAFVQLVGVSDDTTVTMQMKQATAAAGTGSKDVTGALTSATGAGSGANNKWKILGCEQSHLDTNNGFRYVAVARVATGGAATASTIIFLGWRARTMPVTQPASFAEAVWIDG